MRPLPFLFILMPVISALAASTDEGLRSTWTPDVDGQWQVQCVCVSPTASVLQCTGLSLFDAAAGHPRHSWFQTVAGKAGRPIDLSAACHRKRDEKGMGEGLCCEASGDEVSRLFAAKIPD